jgi:hypothetical protein
VHLSAAVSRDSFVLENLGDDPLEDLRIGLFRNDTARHQWAYQESYMASFPLLSPHQTITKDLREFRDAREQVFGLPGGDAVFVDCWVSDSHGIYLFHFFLAKGE